MAARQGRQTDNKTQSSWRAGKPSSRGASCKIVRAHGDRHKKTDAARWIRADCRDAVWIETIRRSDRLNTAGTWLASAFPEL